MSNIKFEDDFQRSTASYGLPPKGMAGWLVDKGVVPNKKTAEIVLLIVTVLCFALTFYVIRSNFITPSSSGRNINYDDYDSRGPGSFDEAL